MGRRLQLKLSLEELRVAPILPKRFGGVSLCQMGLDHGPMGAFSEGFGIHGG